LTEGEVVWLVARVGAMLATRAGAGEEVEAVEVGRAEGGVVRIAMGGIDVGEDGFENGGT
jgi:hypothetical protein